MPPSFMQIFIIFGIVSSWVEKALDDNVITLNEAADLATNLAPVLGITPNLDVSTLTQPTPEASETEEELAGDDSLDLEELPRTPGA